MLIPSKARIGGLIRVPVSSVPLSSDRAQTTYLIPQVSSHGKCAFWHNDDDVHYARLDLLPSLFASLCLCLFVCLSAVQLGAGQPPSRGRQMWSIRTSFPSKIILISSNCSGYFLSLLSSSSTLSHSQLFVFRCFLSVD